MKKYNCQFVVLLDVDDTDDYKSEVMELIEDGYEFVFLEPETDIHPSIAYFRREEK